MPDYQHYQILGAEIRLSALKGLIENYVPRLKRNPFYKIDVRERTDDEPPINTKYIYLDAVGIDSKSKSKPLSMRENLGILAYVKVNSRKSNLMGHSYATSQIGKMLFEDIFEYLKESLGISDILHQEESTPLIPQKPVDKSNYSAWFDYYYEMKKGGERYTLDNLAEDMSLSRSYIGQLHLKYKDKKS